MYSHFPLLDHAAFGFLNLAWRDMREADIAIHGNAPDHEREEDEAPPEP
jgi:hypothetical protein